jgi:hypothetical protein
MNLRLFWEKHNKVLPARLEGGTILAYEDVDGRVCCAPCANDQTYSKHTPRLADKIHVLSGDGTLCDRCLKEIGVEI